MYHRNDFQPNPDHMTTTYNRLKDDQQKELLALIQASANFATIRTMMHQKFKIIISDTTIDFV